MTDLLTALGLMFVFEGVLYFAAPAGMRRLMVQMLSLPDESLRTAGLAGAFAGIALIWVVQRLL